MKKPVIETNPQVVKSIKFNTMSQHQMKKLAVLELYQRDLFDTTVLDRKPATGGVLDNRLGISDKENKCETCGLGIQDCVGHFGVIKFALPVFHIGFYKLMITILQNICKSCAKSLLNEEDKRNFLKKLRSPGLDGVTRKVILKKLNLMCKKCTVCPHCDAINGTVKKVGPLKLIHEKYKKKSANGNDEEMKFRESFKHALDADSWLKPYISRAQEDLNPLLVRNLFETITSEVPYIKQDCELLGLDPTTSRPEEFIWSSFIIPPVCIRPSVGQENASTEDDLTILASEIVDINSKIKTCLSDGAQTSMLIEFWDFLQLQCAMYVTSELPGVASHLQQNLNKIKRGLCQRLKGKQGRFRGNLSGKRVDFSGRTVISPDPNLSIDQVAVPIRVCKILTYPEIVTPYNLERLRNNILNGPDLHPGATYITYGQTGMKRFLKYGNPADIAQKLAVGDIVDRHLQDGDVVLFNRQPSLHKLSIMAHYVKVRPWRTFRFNECVCAPYNADFDGDEMNLHVPQTEEARTEAAQLMGVKSNLVTPRNGEPLIAATQDFITSSYLLSQKDVFYDRSQFALICCYLNDGEEELDLPMPCIVKPIKLWSGKQIFSILLKSKQTSPVSISLEAKCRNFGRDEKHKRTGLSFGNSGADYSMCPKDNWFVLHNSELMCGVVDKAIIGDGNKKSMFFAVLREHGSSHAAEAMNKIAKLSSRWMANRGFSIGIDDVQPGERLRDEKKLMVEQGYSDCAEAISLSLSGLLPKQAGFNDEETLEAKLSGILSKIREDVGTICFSELSKFNAPLIMSLCGSKGSKINVSQMVACVGQQIISGARIPDGFGDRSLPHFPKRSKTPAAKGFVGNSFYSGLTPSEFLFHAVSGREGLVDTAVKTAETGYMSRRLMKALEDLVCHYDLTVRDSSGGLIQFRYGDDGLDPVMIEGESQPVDFERTWRKTVAESCNIPSNPISRKKAIIEIEKSFAEPPFINFSDDYKNSILTFLEKIVFPMASSKFSQTQLTQVQLTIFMNYCKSRYQKAYVEPGTAVGAISAQSIGEPGTQMTLKTFHFAGVASMSITLGVPRIKEIINASKKISTPILTVTLDEAISDYNNQSKYAAETATRVVKGRIEKTVLGDITQYIQELITDTGSYLRIKLDLNVLSKLQLEFGIDEIKLAIIRTSKLKISPADVKLEYMDSLRISCPNYSKKDEDANDYIVLQKLKRALPQIVIHVYFINEGVPTVTRAVINNVISETRFEIMAEGYGLLNVMGINGWFFLQGVDGTRCKSNHILEMSQTLGIEAGRESICREILDTMSSHGMTIDRRHVMLLADLMTFKGEVLGITRFGIAKLKDSVLMLASFEKTTDHLFEASFYGKSDQIKGVSECIILGVPMYLGTGLFKLLQYDEGGKSLSFSPRKPALD